MQRQLTLGSAFRRGAGIFGARLPALLGTYFVGVAVQFGVLVGGMSLIATSMASVFESSGGIVGVALVVVLMALALIVVVGVEYLMVAQIALDAHDGFDRPFGEVVALAFRRLAPFVFRVVVLAVFLAVLRLAVALVLFPLVGLSSAAALVLTILFVVFTVALFVFVLAFLPFAVLEKINEPIRSSVAISFERAFTVLPVLFSMALALILVAVLGIRAEALGLGLLGQLVVVAFQGVVYVFGYCVLCVIYRASSLGEASPRPVLAVPPVPGAFAQFSIMPGATPQPRTSGPPAPAAMQYPEHLDAGTSAVAPGVSAPFPRPAAAPGPAPPEPAWRSVQVTPPGTSAPPQGNPMGGPGQSMAWDWARGAASPPSPSGEVAATDSGLAPPPPPQATPQPAPPPPPPQSWPPRPPQPGAGRRTQRRRRSYLPLK